MSRFENYPIRFGSKIKDPRYTEDMYKITLYANDLEIRAMNYILDSWRDGINPITGRKQTIRDVIMCALQNAPEFAQYWIPYINIEKKRIKKLKQQLEEESSTT